jgi:hypothetical protein
MDDPSAVIAFGIQLELVGLIPDLVKRLSNTQTYYPTQPLRAV